MEFCRHNYKGSTYLLKCLNAAVLLRRSGLGHHHNKKVDCYKVRNYLGRVTNFDQSEARKQCFLASDRLKFETLPRKYRTL